MTTLNVSDSELLILSIEDAIRTQNLPELQQLLLKLPIQYIEVENINILAAQLLNISQIYGNDDITRELVTYFNQTDPNSQNFPFIVKLLLNHDVPSATFEEGVYPLLQYIYSLHPSQGYLETIDTLIENNLGQMLYFALSRLDDVYGTQTEEVYRQALEYASNPDYYNETVIEYLQDHIAEASNYAEVPDWVYNYAGDGEEPAPFESELVYPEFQETPFKLPSLDETVEILTAGLSQLGVDNSVIEDKKNELRTKLENATNLERRAVLQPFLELDQRVERFTGDDDIFRLVGPVNALYGYMEENVNNQSDPCVKYGGCRMLTCDHFLDTDPLTGTVLSDHWFTGTCDMCLLKIRNYSHAVRKPRIMGGWEGCYCSFKCLKESLTEPNLPLSSIIKNVKDQLNTIGIQDRRDDPLTQSTSEEYTEEEQYEE